MTREQQLDVALRKIRSALREPIMLSAGCMIKEIDAALATQRTREHKLEAALRAILSAGRDGCDRCRFQDWWCWAEAREVLATPPTSEWNDAVEEVAVACRMYLGDGIYNSIDGAKCVEIIESFKRKEQP